MTTLHTALDASLLVFFAPVGTCSLRPSLAATQWAAIAVQIVCPDDLSLNQTNLPGADLDVRRTPAGCAPGKAHINYGYAFGRRHPSSAKIRRDYRPDWRSIRAVATASISCGLGGLALLLSSPCSRLSLAAFSSAANFPASYCTGQCCSR